MEFLFRHRRALLIALALPAALILDLVLYPHTLEDAFITFRYSKHFAQGHGLGAWNLDGTRVEGYTSLVWMVVLGWCVRLGANVMTAAKVLGIGAHLAMCAAVMLPRAARPTLDGKSPTDPHESDIRLLAGAWLALSLPVCWYASTGMETLPFAFLLAVLTVTIARPSRAAAVVSVLVSALLVLMRPEGAMVALLFNGYVAWREYRTRRWGRGVLGFAAAGAALVFITALRVKIYGQPLPNTYYAKADGAPLMHFKFGVTYLLEWIGLNQALVVGLVVAAFHLLRSRGKAAHDRWAVLWIAFLAVFIAYVAKVGGDNTAPFPYWRHMVHVAPLLALVLAWGLFRTFSNRPGHCHLLFLGALILTNVGIMTAPGFIRTELKTGWRQVLAPRHAEHPRFMYWVRDFAAPNTTIATSLAGELPFIADQAVYIDMLGLNNHHIARHGRFNPPGPVDSKTDMAYVVAQRPDIIEGYVSAFAIQIGAPRTVNDLAARQIFGPLLDHPDFKADYLFLKNGPYDSLNRALFLRRDYWETHPRRAELQAVPVTETSIYP